MRCTGSGEREAEVVSLYQIRTGPGVSSDLLLPLGNARELRAWLHGREIHPRIVPGATHADLRLPPSDGLHRLRIQRQAPVTSEGVVTLPVLPAATAGLKVTAVGGTSRVQMPGAFGPLEIGPEGVAGRLGPAATIEVRWLHDEDTGPVAEGTVEGLFLWDLEPAGDRVRARLTYRNPEGTSRLRLQLEPGLVVRSASFAGWSEARWSGTERQPVWEAPLSPPLADGGTVVLEFWRPAGSTTERAESRSLPRIMPLGTEAHLGIVAVRMPESWSARFEPAAISDPILEDLFLRSWGPFPEAQTGLIGAVSWARSDGVTARFEPESPQPVIQPSMRLELAPGRADLRVEARCVEKSGRLRALRVRLPKGLRVLRVEADGLTSWSASSPGELWLHFGAMEATERQVRIEGWVPALSVAEGRGNVTQELPLPWIQWPDAVVNPGPVAISAPPTAPFRVEETRGLVAVRAPGTGRDGGGPGAVPGDLDRAGGAHPMVR